MNEGPESRKHLPYYLAVAAGVLTFAVYIPSLGNDFVNWDDTLYISENPFIRVNGAAFLKWAFLNFYAANWHPLTWLSHALDYTVWGLNPLGHHLTNNILHGINTSIVVLLAVRLIEAVHDSRFATHDSRLTAVGNSRFTLIAAGVTGLLFGLHPLHVESVAWVSERKDLLCALFFLLSIMSYLRYASNMSQRAEGKEQRTVSSVSYAPGPMSSFKGAMLFALFFFALALMSKPMAVSLPGVLLVLDWYPFRRIGLGRQSRSVLVEKLPFILLSIASSVVTLAAQKSQGATELMGSMPIPAKLLVASKAIIVYILKMVLPFNLIPFYRYPDHVSLLMPQFFFPAILCLSITAASFLAASRRRFWVSIWTFYVITLLPVLGIIQIGYQSMADRYTYLPSLGPFLIAGVSTAWLFNAKHELKKRTGSFYLAGAALIFIITSISYMTVKQTGLWKTSICLWTHVIDNEPSSPDFVYDNRGSAYNDAGDFELAMKDFNKAIALNPLNFLAYRNRGSSLINMGRLDLAIKDLDKSIVLKPSAQAHYTRGMVFERQGNPEKALEDYERAVALNPSHAAAYFSMGVLYGKLGVLDRAINCFDKVIQFSPGYSLAYGNRGLAYSLIGQYDSALQDLDKAVALNKRYAAAYLHRGNVKIRLGQKDLAVLDFQIACDLGQREGCVALSSEHR